jgi:hypothetical protein
MKRIYVYSFSLFISVFTQTMIAQDSLRVPIDIKAGLDILGPIYYLIKPGNMTLEGYIAYDYDIGKSIILEAGHQNYGYSQYNYIYGSKGTFFRGGMDFNLLKPFPSEGKYYAGVGLRYGISFYNYEVPEYTHENYWGIATSSISVSNHVAHFVEIDPGIRTKLMKNVSIGFNVRLKFMVSSGTGKELKPVYIPGYGNGTKGFSPGINYYISICIPYRYVFVKPEVEKNPDKEKETETGKNNTGSGF